MAAGGRAGEEMAGRRAALSCFLLALPMMHVSFACDEGYSQCCPLSWPRSLRPCRCRCIVSVSAVPLPMMRPRSPHRHGLCNIIIRVLAQVLCHVSQFSPNLGSNLLALALDANALFVACHRARLARRSAHAPPRHGETPTLLRPSSVSVLPGTQPSIKQWYPAVPAWPTPNIDALHGCRAPQHRKCACLPAWPTPNGPFSRPLCRGGGVCILALAPLR